MFMNEYFDRREALMNALDKNYHARLAVRHNPTSAEAHRLNKERKELKKALKKLEDQYWG